MGIGCAWLVVLFTLLVQLPFFADDYAQLARTAHFASVAGAFDFEQVIWRPLETLLFYGMNASGLDAPWVGHLWSMGLHVLVAGLFFVLAQRLGGTRSTAALAALLFVLAPNTRTLGWTVAHGTLARSVLVLLGLFLFQDRERRPVVAALGSGACLALGLLFHTAAIELPALCLLWLLVFDTRWTREGLRRLPRALGSPALICQLLVAAGYVALTLMLPHRYHGVAGLGSLPASAVRVTTFAMPEELRVFVVEGLRGASSARAVLAGSVVVTAWAVLGGVLWRGSKALRFLILAVVLDLLPYVISIGFSMRYAYFAFGLIAVGLALWAESRRRLAMGVMLVVAGSWAFDTILDVKDQHEASQIVANVIEAARTAREEVGPTRPIALVDLPEVWGREEDLTLMNWGVQDALTRAGIGGPFELLRTAKPRSATESRTMSSAELAAFTAERGALVLWFDAARLTVASSEPKSVLQGGQPAR